jgi:hypothetical protein
MTARLPDADGHAPEGRRSRHITTRRIQRLGRQQPTTGARACDCPELVCTPPVVTAVPALPVIRRPRTPLLDDGLRDVGSVRRCRRSRPSRHYFAKGGLLLERCRAGSGLCIK